MVAKIIMLVVFFAVMIGVGLYCRKHATDVNGFVLGGRSVGPWLTAFAYGTSYFSAVIFIGYAGQFGWKFGIASTWIGIGNAIIGSLLAWVILGRRTRLMSQHLNSATMPEFFEKRFGSVPLKVIASAIIFIFMIPYTASLYNGLSRLFGMAFNIDYTVCIIIMAILTAVYVVAGGYMAAIARADAEFLSNPANTYDQGDYLEVAERIKPKETISKIKYATLDEQVEAEEIASELKSYVYEKMAGWFTGVSDVEADWDAYLAELEAIGLSRYLELSQKAWN